MQTIEMDESVMLTDSTRQLNAARLKIADLEAENARIPAMQRQFERIDAALDASRELSGEAMAQCVDREHIITDLARGKTDLTRKIAELEHRLADAARQVNELNEELWTMPLDRAHAINAACCDLVLRRIIGDPLPGDTEPSIAEYTLGELLEAKRVIEAAEDEAEKLRKPGEGYTLHTTCDDRLLAALYACQHYEGSDEGNLVEPIVVIGRKALCVVNVPERRDEE